MNELQVAVMQWELTLVEHPDSVKTAPMTAMLPKDMLERFLDGPFNYEELRIRVAAYVGEKLAGQETNSGVQPMDIGQLDRSDGDDEDANAAQRCPHNRFNQKPKQESDNERKPFNRQTANSSPSASRQSTPREKKSANDETKQNATRKKRLVCYRCGGKGHPARLCPSPDDCQDVDEVGTEAPSDADSDLFGLDWGDDPVVTINSVTKRHDRTRGGKEFLAFVDSSAVDNVLPKMVCTE